MSFNSIFILLPIWQIVYNISVRLLTDQHDANGADGFCDIDLVTVGFQCSLRAAVEQSNNLPLDDRVFFNLPANSTIILTTANHGEILIGNSGTLQIIGTGANNLTIDGGAGTNRIFYIASITMVTISGMTLTGGNAQGLKLTGNGGAILAESSSLTLDSVHVTGNTSSDYGGGMLVQNSIINITNSTFSNNRTQIGGGAYFRGSTSSIINSTFSANSTTIGVGAVGFVGGTYLITGSTFSANSASERCGGIYSSESNLTTLTIVNSTISGNIASTRYGGGICNFQNLTLRNVTITNNTATSGGGIFQGGTLNFGNTIVAGNIATTGFYPEIQYSSGIIISAGGNLVGDSPGDSANTAFPIAYHPTDILDVNPLLGALQNNGGTTPTHALLVGSPAIDAGLNTLTSEAFDQRGTGFPRIQDGNSDGTAIVDIGAFEVQLAPTAATVSVSGRVMAGRRYISNAVVHLTSQSGKTQTARTNFFGYYNFKELAAGETYIFNVYSKRYQFTPKIVTLTEDLDELNFTAQ